MTEQRSSSAPAELAEKIGEANLPAIDIYKAVIRVDPGYYVLMPVDLRDEVWRALRTGIPAQVMPEPVTFVVYAPNGNIRLWSQTGDVAKAYAAARDLVCVPLYASSLLPSTECGSGE